MARHYFDEARAPFLYTTRAPDVPFLKPRLSRPPTIFAADDMPLHAIAQFHASERERDFATAVDIEIALLPDIIIYDSPARCWSYRCR